jgi:hypothetical protein
MSATADSSCGELSEDWKHPATSNARHFSAKRDGVDTFSSSSQSKPDLEVAGFFAKPLLSEAEGLKNDSHEMNYREVSEDGRSHQTRLEMGNMGRKQATTLTSILSRTGERRKAAADAKEK